MPAKPLDKKEALRTVAAVHRALERGCTPLGRHVQGTKDVSAVGEAARELGIPPGTVAYRLAKNGPCARLGVFPDWGRWKKPAERAIPDPIELRRLSDQRTAAVARAVSAERAAISATSLREGVFRIASDIPVPPTWRTKPVKQGGHHREVLVLPLSDVHMGEVVDLNEMAGRNSYDAKIATARLERLFQGYVSLGTTHWTGPPPEAIYLVLLGDLITGSIHEELSKTNDLLSVPAVKQVSACLIAGINLLLNSFECPIYVVSLPGNHGRTTHKPESKRFAVDSYDTLVAWNIESWYAAKGIKRVQFTAPTSGDALITIHGWNFLFTHGDRIGSRGGQGFVGPAATIARGMQKVLMDYAADGVVIDYVVVGHFHTALELEQGFANGPLIGPSEYSKTFRMRSAPASQWMLSVHPRIGVAKRLRVHVGVPSEGSIYRGREHSDG